MYRYLSHFINSPPARNPMAHGPGLKGCLYQGEKKSASSRKQNRNNRENNTNTSMRIRPPHIKKLVRDCQYTGLAIDETMVEQAVF